MILRMAMVVALIPGVALADKTFSKGTGETWDCAKDAVVNIKTSKGTYGFHGECKKISISGGKNAVSIESVGKLLVSGADNLIDVETLDTVVVSGRKNKVTFKKAAKGDKPNVKVSNKTSKVEQAK